MGNDIAATDGVDIGLVPDGRIVAVGHITGRKGIAHVGATIARRGGPGVAVIATRITVAARWIDINVTWCRVCCQRIYVKEKRLGRNRAGGRGAQPAFPRRRGNSRIGPDIVAKGRIAHREGEAVWRSRTIRHVGGLVITDIARCNIGLSKASAVTQDDPAISFRPHASANIQLNFTLCRPGADGKHQLVFRGGLGKIARIAVVIQDLQHGSRQHGGLGSLGDIQRATHIRGGVGERGIVVVGIHGKGNGRRDRRRGYARAAARISHGDTIRRRNGARRIRFCAVLEKFELGAEIRALSGV